MGTPHGVSWSGAAGAGGWAAYNRLAHFADWGDSQLPANAPPPPEAVVARLVRQHRLVGVGGGQQLQQRAPHAVPPHLNRHLRQVAGGWVQRTEGEARERGWCRCDRRTGRNLKSARPGPACDRPA